MEYYLLANNNLDLNVLFLGKFSEIYGYFLPLVFRITVCQYIFIYDISNTRNLVTSMVGLMSN